MLPTFTSGIITSPSKAQSIHGASPVKQTKNGSDPCNRHTKWGTTSGSAVDQSQTIFCGSKHCPRFKGIESTVLTAAFQATDHGLDQSDAIVDCELFKILEIVLELNLGRVFCDDGETPTNREK